MSRIITVACSMGVPVFLYFGKLFVNLLTAKIDSLRADERLCDKEVARIELGTAQKAIQAAVEASVGKLEQIIGKDLRQQVKNGMADQSEIFALASEAYYEVMRTVQPELLQKLSNSLQDVELYIRNQIEHQLLLLKAKMNGGAANEETEP